MRPTFDVGKPVPADVHVVPLDDDTGGLCIAAA
jgi:hypothetical protein